MAEFYEKYAKEFQLTDIVVLSSKWRTNDTNDYEYTADRIICRQGGKYYRMNMETFRCPDYNGHSISHYIKKQAEISEKKFNKLKKERENLNNHMD